MKNKIAALIFLMLCCHAYSQERWVVQTSTIKNNLNSVFFLDTNVGYAVGDSGTILKTFDGGTTWDPSSSRTSGMVFFSVFSINNAPTLAVGRGSIGATGSVNAVYKSIGFGSGFTDSPVPNNTATLGGALYSIYCTTVTVCYSVGYHIIIKTTDGGSSWSRQTNSAISSHSLYSIYCTGSNTCYAGGSGIILKTTNGGTDWITQYSGNAGLRSIFFTDSLMGYAAGDSAVLLKTSNGGATWTSISLSPINQNLTSVYFVNASTGYLVGNGGVIYKSNNAGASWVSQASGTTAKLNSASFPNASIGYAVGDGGVVLKHLPNGGTPIISPPSSPLKGLDFKRVRANGVRQKSDSKNSHLLRDILKTP